MATNPPPALAPGLAIDRFVLEREIGKGGMGAVWAARDDTGKVFALKLLLGEDSENPKSRARLLREARSAMRVRHPNVVPVLEVLESVDGMPCLVMPLLTGETLRQRLDREGSLSVPETTRVLIAVTAGVRAVHSAGMAHRDIKPENVFLHESDVLLIDFGIAKDVSRASLGADGGGPTEASLTSTGVVLGTPFYMAPEQVFGDHDVDGRADVWALGVMLFECIAGVRPTQADGLGQLLKLVTSEGLPNLAEVAPYAPPAIAALVMRMLSRRREERPSLDEIEQTLRQATQGAKKSATTLGALPLELLSRTGQTSPLASTIPTNLPEMARPLPPSDPPTAPTEGTSTVGAVLIALFAGLFFVLAVAGVGGILWAWRSSSLRSIDAGGAMTSPSAARP